MKKILLIATLTATTLTALAQDSTTTKKVYHNEFGVDATGFIKQFANLNSSSTTYSPTYYLTYRRYFKCGNIRLAVGGDFSNATIPSSYVGDPNTYHNNSNSLNARIGWEFVSELSKRWQVFYGLDLRPALVYSKNDAVNFNGGYAQGDETKSQIYGVAPVLGFRFNLTNRLSIITETSFSINMQKDWEHKYFTPTSSAYPPPMTYSPTTAQKMFSSYGQPLSVFIVFKI